MSELKPDLKPSPEPRVPERRIIQISSVAESDKYPPYLHALCNDGTLWRLRRTDGWTIEPQVPQYEIVPEPLE